MHIKKNDLPVKINVHGATARQKTKLGDSTGFGKLAGEYYLFRAGQN